MKQPEKLCDIPVHFDGWEAASVSGLKPHPKNNRKHSDKQVALLAKSIRAQGWRWGIIVSRDSGFIVAGHARREAALLMQLDKVPVIYQSFESEEHEKAYRLADNRIAELADIQQDAINELLEELTETGFDLDLTGYDEDKIAHMKLNEIEEENQIDLQEENRERLRQKYRVESGQIWTLGNHRVICGDATDPEVVASLFGGAKPGIMVTDPPYGVEYDAGWRVKAKLNKQVAAGVVKNDHRADWSEAYALFPGAVAYVWHSSLHSSTFAESLRSCGFNLRSCIIWEKNTPVIGRGNYHWQHEPCWYAVKEGQNARFTADRKQATVWRIGDDGQPEERQLTKSEAQEYASSVWWIDKPLKSETGHSTQKPVECMARPMRNHTIQTVYDPFLGSGTSLIAAENERRTLYAVELSPQYVAIAIERWAAHTGGEPKLNASI